MGVLSSVPLPRHHGRPKGRLFALLTAPPLFVRYVLVAGVLGVPLSIAQLWVMLWMYGALIGEPGLIAVNALWFVNFEIGLLRNFGLHCAYTWQIPPSWQRTRDAHVAAVGAIVIDFAAFNAVLLATGIVPLAQLVGAASGFVFNYGYNKVKTFARTRTVEVEGATS